MPFDLNTTLACDEQILRRLHIQEETCLTDAEAAIDRELETMRRLELTAAVRIYLARRHHDSAAAWVQWAQDRFRLGRRTVYEALAAANLVMHQGRRHEVLLSLRRPILAALDTAEPAKLRRLVERHHDPDDSLALDQVSRDEIRALIAGTARASKPTAPETPAEQWQQLMLFDPDELDPVQEARCLGAYIERVKAVAPKIEDDDFERIVAGLEESIAELRAARIAAAELANAS